MRYVMLSGRRHIAYRYLTESLRDAVGIHVSDADNKKQQRRDGTRVLLVTNKTHGVFISLII